MNDFEQYDLYEDAFLVLQDVDLKPNDTSIDYNLQVYYNPQEEQDVCKHNT